MLADTKQKRARPATTTAAVSALNTRVAFPRLVIRAEQYARGEPRLTLSEALQTYTKKN